MATHMSLQVQDKTTPKSTTSFAPARSSLLQRKCACGSTAGIDGECAECRSKRLALQRQSAGQTGLSTVSPIVHDVLRSPGQPLDSATRAFMEPRFGHDFSKVRVHTNAQAAESARAVNALAYTVGRDMVFGTGQYKPGTSEGRRLLAHELTHAVQQQGSEQGLQAQTVIGPPDDRFEREANQAAEQVVPRNEGETPQVLTIEESMPVVHIAAYRIGRQIEKSGNELQDLPRSISRLSSGQRIQRVCTKTVAEAGYPVSVDLTVPPTPTPNHAHNTAWISARAHDPSGQTTGLTEYTSLLRWRLVIGKGRHNSWVTNLRVQLQNPSIRIFLTNAIVAGSCEYTDLLRHEGRHDTDLRTNIRSAEASICNNAVGWPSTTRPLLKSVLSAANLRTEIDDWMALEKHRIDYDNWLDSCAWDSIDYPRLYTVACPGTHWQAPRAHCPAPPSSPVSHVFPLPRKA